MTQSCMNQYMYVCMCVYTFIYPCALYFHLLIYLSKLSGVSHIVLKAVFCCWHVLSCETAAELGWKGCFGFSQYTLLPILLFKMCFEFFSLDSYDWFVKNSIELHFLGEYEREFDRIIDYCWLPLSNTIIHVPS